MSLKITLAVFLLSLVHIGALGEELTSDFLSNYCKPITPGHVYSLSNETLNKCFIPLAVHNFNPNHVSCKPEDSNSLQYPRCVENSQCLTIHDSRGRSFANCMCKKNFKTTSYFTCDPIKGRDQVCNRWLMSADTLYESVPEYIDDCDNMQGLKCKNGTCQCGVQVEEAGQTVCLLAPGSLCSLESNATRCGQNSVCYPLESLAVEGVDAEKMGFCKCEKGFINTGRTCSKLKAFGEQCGEDRRDSCEDSAGLTCRSGFCGCELPSKDPGQTWCTISIGGSCMRREASGDPEVDARAARCPQNSECKEGLCKCNEKFEEKSESECVPLRFAGEKCDDRHYTDSCHRMSGLTCEKGKCRCQEETNSDPRSCIIRAGYGCLAENSTAHCTPNSICKAYEYSSTPNSGSCSCLDGFVSGSGGKCYRMLNKGDACKSGYYKDSNFCNRNKGLDCKESKCTCSNGEDSSGKCKLKVNDYCSKDNSTSLCPSSAMCNGDGDYATCSCSDGHKPSPNRDNCVIERGHMERCGESQGLCRDGLTCKNGHCQCHNADEQVFDPASSTCKNKRSCSSDSQCPEYGECRPLYSGSRVSWCECKEGYSKSAQGLCKSKYLTVCGKSSECHSERSIDCIDGVCRCSAVLQQTYDKSQDACVGLAGFQCGTRNRKCDDNAHCGPDGVCSCVPGTSMSNSGKCLALAGFGMNCSVSGRRERGHGMVQCDWSKGFACRDSVCSCLDPNSMEFLETEGTCVGRRGSRCAQKISVGKCAETEATTDSNACNYYTLRCKDGLTCKDSGNRVSYCQ